MTAPDLLAVLTRADQRWATKQADDPAPTHYLAHLAAALTPLLQPGGAPVDLDDQQRLKLEAANSRNELLEEELDATNTWLVAVVTLATGTAWSDNTDSATQVQAAFNRIHTLLNEPVLLRDPNLQHQLDEARADLERALAQRHTANLNYEASRQEHLRTLEHLARLVDAINEEWHPDDDITTQVDRAVQLVTAAAEQLNQRVADGRHVHQYPRNPSTGRINPCGCGHKIPKTARASLTGPTKGAA